MVDIVAIHTEPDGSSHLEHITQLRYVETASAGERGTGPAKDCTRHQMYEFVRDHPRQAYAISRNDNRWAYLEAVNNGHTQYVRTVPDSTRTDNLLSLPRF